MSVDLLKRIERDLCSIGEELWKVDGQDDVLDGVLKEISLLKAQLNVQKSLQPIANLLRRQPMKRALPNQKATKVKRFIRFIFRKGSGEDRYKELRNLDCDVLKFCGLTYTVEELVKLDDAEFDILKRGAADFVRHRNLSSLLYRPDVDKAVESTFEDPDDEDLYDKFLNAHSVLRQEFLTRKRKRKDEVLETPATAPSAEVESNRATLTPSLELVSRNEPTVAQRSSTRVANARMYSVETADIPNIINSGHCLPLSMLTYPSNPNNSPFLIITTDHTAADQLSKNSQQLGQ